MFALILAGALAFTPADAQIAFGTVESFTAKCSPRDAGTLRGRLAANFILDAASAQGADARIDRFEAKTPNGILPFSNVIAEWKTNPTGEWVVVVSHFDTKRGMSSPFANDGGSTTGLLVALAGVVSREVRSAEKPSVNIMLAWLDGEECMNAYGENDGLWGSKRAARWLKESGRRVKAVICLDMLGDGDLNISLPRNTSAWLRKVALAAAKRVGESGRVSEIRELVKDDHLPFLIEGFDAVDLIDFAYGNRPGSNNYWHTPQDTIDKISADSLLVSGRIVCEMLNILQRQTAHCKRQNKKGARH